MKLCVSLQTEPCVRLKWYSKQHWNNAMTLTISKVQARPVMAPLARPISTAQVSIPKAPLVLFDIETHDGIVGRSYIFAYTPLILRALVDFAEDLAETLIDEPATPLDVAARMFKQFALLGRQGVVGMVLAGIDMALWDIAARARDCSVAQLLGAEHKPLLCYDSQGVFVPGRDEHLVEDTLARGFRAVKFKLGFETAQEDLAALKIIRDMIGPDMPLMLDFNQSLTAPEAIRRIRLFEDSGIDLSWVEEPVPAEDFAGYQMVRANVSTPIQSGENWWHPEDAARAIQAGTTDYAMPDLVKIGGFTGWQRAAPIAQAASIPVSSHLFIEASTHALAATSNAHYLEFMDIAGSLLVDPYALENGCLTPRGPGLGIEWNEDVVSANLA